MRHSDLRKASRRTTLSRLALSAGCTHTCVCAVLLVLLVLLMLLVLLVLLVARCAGLTAAGRARVAAGVAGSAALCRGDCGVSAPQG